MLIEVWSDYVCPFCFIGKKRLEQALEQFSEREQVRIQFKSFQLDPHATYYNGESYYENLGKKFGSIEQAKQMTANVQSMAQTVGLKLQFEQAKPTNTYRAHRLLKLADEVNKNNELTEKLFQAHFLEGKDIGDVATLVDIAESIGLTKEDAQKALKDEKAYVQAVEKDLAEARQFQITGVPFFVFNRKFAISGAREKSIFTQALTKAWENK